MLIWKIIFQKLINNKISLIGFCIFIYIVLFSFIGPFFIKYDAYKISLSEKNLPPSKEHLLGTDILGRDVLARTMEGGKISISISFFVSVIRIVIGTISGCVSGFYGGKIDGIIMMVVDILLSLPLIPIILLCTAVLSSFKVNPNYTIIISMVILGIFGWAGLCRLIRGEVMVLCKKEFVLASEILGAKSIRIIKKHILPNILPIVIVNGTLNFGRIIMVESTLSFLGLGVIPPTPSWGNMILLGMNLNNLSNRPWIWIPSGICIIFIIFSVNIIGDSLKNALNPKNMN